ncbi:electron transfer flavoprotein alpha subunit apoprotein [Halanaerobium saccharolyticum]|uniref:Electron transfer flavoprotein alpha subunit apoprotein n=1 Tax=Halanaerobium saccharolyticum TaxID=43595 RepID=A0A4R7YSS0_9FIRM|nr:electron transfer flavoprotein subunit alpha/FixB family protein [Halanaerobium saccharolyticum]RAK05058.1 electron transfer flavoprotein alpha subunit apoprotein [Halanaerobium saccharolyticum]TDV98844.1 electron transfer flavoprotein alpha subunit apoprotein [Halanaerobium saccharolyticum]TDX51495.1 electron transfer flavoprotein alpha subunit apoprotein [Halanaerobium saccharolyticum]
MADKNKLLIIAEYSQNRIHPVVFELLNKGRKLADKADLSLSVLIAAADNIENKELNELIYHGADEVQLIVNKNFSYPDEYLFKKAILNFLDSKQLEIILIGATHFGRSLAPGLAAAMKTGLTADCTELEIAEDGSLLQIRPAFSENILAHIKSNTRPQMATVRYQEFTRAVRDESRKGKISIEKITLKENKSLKKVEKISDQKINITEAEVVVAGGSGVKTREDFKMLQELADIFNGVVAVSRDIVDKGLMPRESQVGYSGQRVKPKLYFAFGISGAPQHLAGMKESETIIAVNTDPSAPIFKAADYAIEGDLYEIIPEMIKKYKKS